MPPNPSGFDQYNIDKSFLVLFFKKELLPSSFDSTTVRIGVHAEGPHPADGLDAFDILLSIDANAPTPWVSVPSAKLNREIENLRTAVRSQPVAAAVAAQVLRMTLALTFDQALILESMAYSMLLASEGFRAWRNARPVRVRGDADEARVAVDYMGATHVIRLTRAASRNAVDAGMRDALVDALEAAWLDQDGGPVLLSGDGPAFCAGGDLDEFGQATDAGRAHAIRVMQSPARLAHALGDRLTVELHGACVGAGIEIPAAAGRVLARPGTVCRLPELAMGLIPGAGGTASIARRIGRHRACYMAFSWVDIDTGTALAWGLIDGLKEEP
jgi:enoyl-CoA hydratase/carnithine racemase